MRGYLRMTGRSMRPSLVALTLLLLGLYRPSAGDPPPPASAPRSAQPASGARMAVEAARARAKLLHGVFDSTLHVVHHHYFRRDRATVPARALQEVFADLARREGIEAHWIAVNTKAMSIDHKPKSDFEKQAAKALAGDQSEYERVVDGKLLYAARISLNGRGCISCHVGLRASAKKKRFAGLVLKIPTSKP